MSYGLKSYKSLQIPQIEDLYDLKKFVQFLAKRLKNVKLCGKR